MGTARIAPWWMVVACSVLSGAVAERSDPCDASKYHCCGPAGAGYCRQMDLVAVCDPSAGEDRRLAMEGSGCACPRGSEIDTGAGRCVAPNIPSDGKEGVCVAGDRQCEPCLRETDCGSTDWAACVKKADLSANG